LAVWRGSDLVDEKLTAAGEARNGALVTKAVS
jgi:hypothetical protein